MPDIGNQFRPTAEQQEALRLFATGEHLAIEAGAGCGKTATLKLLAESAPGRTGQYLAFNKAIVEEAARKMPANVHASTIHSVAFRAVGKRFGARLRSSKRMKSAELARRLFIDPLVVRYGDEHKPLAAGFLAGQVMQALELFCQSADPEPTERHFPYIEGIDQPSIDGDRTYANNREVRSHLLPALRRAWADAQNPDGDLPYKHSYYLKVFERTGPVILAEFILIDEAQDVSPVMASIFMQQRNRAQLVFVGDSAQCQPAGTMVTVVDSHRRGNRHTGAQPTAFRQVAIEQVQPGDVVASFSMDRSFLRRTGRRVAQVAARPFDGELVSVTLPDGSTSSYTPEHRCVVRAGEALVDKWAVYLMRRGGSFRVGLVKGVYESQQGDLGLPRRLRAENADAAWVLSTHDSEAEARVAEAVTAWRYGIPSLRFRQGTRYGMTQDELDAFWGKMGDLSNAAESCLIAHRRLIAHPLVSAGRRIWRRRSQTVHACNLLDGMLVLPMTGALDAGGKQVPQKRWQPVVIGRRWFTGTVHSLRIEEDETYVADGIVTHNCIYGFTGAVNALADIRAEGVATAWLSESFRFGPAIADVANGLLARAGHELRLVGRSPWASVVAPLAEPNCVLTRTNAEAVRTVLSAQADGRSAALMGGGAEVKAFAEAAAELMAGRWTSHPDLACFSDWAQVCDYVSNDPQGSEIRLMVKLVEDFSTATIIEALSRTVRQGDADVVASTAHKAKGCEWDSVQIAGDFQPGKEDSENSAEELRLMYVAATRARRELDLTLVPHFLGAPSAPKPNAAPLPTAETPAALSEASSGLSCPSCGRVDVGRGGLIGAHRCEAVAR